MLNVRIRGIDTAIRDLVRTEEDVYDEARRGINEAAEHLMGKIVEKIGKYNPTGGDPGGHGAWKKLKFQTVKKKLMHGYSSAPLIMTGGTKNSFSIKEGGVGRLAASVHSSSDVLAYHVYGAPSANVPMRDPARITAKEESDTCHKIIEDHIIKAIRRSD